jgi:hypothetical protein
VLQRHVLLEPKLTLYTKLPERYTWQDLKDLVRNEAAHGIWTEMASLPNGQTGKTGWARVKRREEARRLYCKLEMQQQRVATILRLPTAFLASTPVQDKRLRVHLFDTSISPPQVIACTCGHSPCVAKNRLADFSHATANPSAGQPVANNLGYVQPTAYAVQAPLPYSYPHAATMSASVSPHMAPAYSMQSSEVSMANMRTTTAIPPEMMAANRAPFMYAQQIAPQQMVNPTQVARYSQGPMYVSSSTGTHVNVSQGAIKTEARGIFVSNVDYKASSKDLQRYFGRAGEIVKCQLQKDPATGKSKGNATVQYAVAKDAQNAVRMFNSEQYMGMRLKVRLDKEPVAIGMPSAGSSSRTNGSAAGNGRTVQQNRNNAEPIIVNGSTCQK